MILAASVYLYIAYFLLYSSMFICLIQKDIYPKNDLNVHDLRQQILNLHCLPIPALGFIYKRLSF